MRRARPSARIAHGFTLVELLVVIVIVSILASVGLPLAELAHRRQQEAELRLALRQIRDALDAYKRAADQGRVAKLADESGYPPRLEVLVQGVPDQTDPQRRKLFFLRRIPRDPFTEVTATGGQASWGLRSYVSDPDEPREGRDVYDVYSLSQQIGINGIAYAKW